MSLSVIAPAASELLSSSDAALRQHLRLENDEVEQDASIDAYCAAARDKVERYLRRRLITQTLRLTRSGFPRRAICLDVAPVASIASVSYRDDAGVWQVVPSTVYRLIDSATPAEIGLVHGQVWPVTLSERANVRVDFAVGYGASVADVPASIVQAVRFLVAHMFEHRQPAVIGKSVAALPMSVVDLLDPYRVFV